ncbi:MAG: hypothetical protein E7A06_12420 [Clostridiales bacterium]|nr:hypothetical protein [Clostridiales bacterium]
MLDNHHIVAPVYENFGLLDRTLAWIDTESLFISENCARITNGTCPHEHRTRRPHSSDLTIEHAARHGGASSLRDLMIAEIIGEIERLIEHADAHDFSLNSPPIEYTPYEPELW